MSYNHYRYLLLTREISIERLTSEIRFLSLHLVHEIGTKWVANWKQDMIKVSNFP